MKKVLFLFMALMFSMMTWAQTVLISPTGDGGFETGPTFADNGWTTVNDATNKWFVGTVATPFAGTNSAFISNDNGVSYAYTMAGTQVSYFYRDITVPAGEPVITLSFQWKNNGESGSWDRPFVYTAPTTSTPVANSMTVTGSTDITGTTNYLVLQTTYQTATYNLPAALAGTTFRLIIGYKNDGSGGTNPPASIDNISLTSRATDPLHGLYTINNTLPTTTPLLHDGSDNFNSFTAAINYLHSDGFTAAVTFNVTAGQTFAENTPIITATGTVANTITFVKSGAGANPVITPTGTSGTTDAGITIAGGDYITFDGIDINASAVTAVEYGYYVRNASVSDGAQYNVVKNCAITLNRNTTTATSSSAAIYQNISSTPSSAAGANSYNKYYNLTIQNAINGIYLNGHLTYRDISCEIGTTDCATRNTITNVGPTTSTYTGAKGIWSLYQEGIKIWNNDITTVAGNQATTYGIWYNTCYGSNEIYNNKIQGVNVFGATSTTYLAYGVKLENANSGTNNLRFYNNFISNIYTSFTGTATATRYAIGMHFGLAGATSSQSYDIDNNTINIGAGLAPTYSNTCAEIQNGLAVYRVRGNIFANSTNAQAGNAKHFCIVATAAGLGTTGTTFEYNDYFIANDLSTSGHTGRNQSGPTNYNLLSDWQGFTSGTLDDLSLAIDPILTSANDLHASASGLSAVAGFATQAWILNDIDCQDRSTLTPADLGADSFDPPSCVQPTALTSSNLNYTTATISWTAPAGTPDGYEYEVRTSGTAGSGATGLAASGTTSHPVVTANITGLAGATTYTYYVRTDCSSSNYSTWASGTFNTLSCNVPTGVVASAITTTTATITWVAPVVGSPAGYEYEVRSSGAAGSGATGLAASGTTLSPIVTANIIGLSDATTYSIYVRTNCSVGFYSAWTTAVVFNTECNTEVAPTTVQTFATYTGTAPQPVCWKEATGTLAPTTTLTGTTSKWTNSDGFANTGTNVAVITNLYGTYNDWLISNAIDLGATPGQYRLSYRYAVTGYDNTTSQATLGTHKVSVVISTDGGLTWSDANIIKQYTGAATYSNTGVTETINLTGYSGVVKFALVQTTNSYSPDIDFHFDDFVIEEMPSCVEPTALAYSAVTSNSATISWTASVSDPANGYDYYYSTTTTTPDGATVPTGSVAAGVTTANLASLSASTTYYFWVRSNCDGTNYSSWTGYGSFTTPCAPAATLSENFDAVTTPALPTCWYKVGTTGSAYTQNSSSSTAPNCLYMYSSGSTSVATVAMPPLSNAGDGTHFLKFSARANYTTGAIIEIGYLTNPTDAASFVLLDSKTLTLAYQQFEIFPGTVPGLNNTLAFRASYSPANSLLIDNVSWQVIPTCYQGPTALTSSAITSSAATISWTAPASAPANGYQYFLATTATPVPDGTTVPTGTTAAGITTVNLSSLTENTGYYIWVRANCDDVNFSGWAGSLNFTTLANCVVPTALVSSAITTSSATISWTASVSAPANGYEYYVSTSSTPAPDVATTATGITLAGVTTANLSSLAANTTYYFWVRSNCDGVNYSAWAGYNSFYTGYCVSTSTSSAYYISNFVTTGGDSNISNNSAGYSATGYGNFTAMSASKYAESSVNFTTTWNTTGGVGYGLWIDWNNDMDFGDANETVYITGSYNYANSYSGTITIPASTPVGSYRMRMKMDFNSSVPTSCGSITQGETEDYTFEVIAAPICSQLPTALTSSAITTSEATISWTAPASAPANGYQYYVSTTATPVPNASTVPTGVTVAGTTSVDLSTLVSGTTYYFWVRANCDDVNFSDWAGTSSFTTACDLISTFPWTENFQTITTPALPNCWSQNNANADVDFWKTWTTYGVGGSNAAGIYTDVNGGNNNDYLILPQFTLNGNQRLKYFVSAYSAGEPNDYRVVLSTTGNAPADFTTELLPLTTVSNTTMTEISPIDLSAYTGNVYIAIHIPAGGLDGWYIYFDNFTVEDIPACLEPTALTTTAVTTSTATISWTAPASAPANGYQYFVATTSTPVPDGTTVPTGMTAAGVTSVDLSLLSSATQYYVWVRSNCDNINFSIWAGSVSFATECTTVSSFTENFESTTEENFPICWAKVGATGGAYPQASTGISGARNLYMYNGATVRMRPVSNAGAGTHQLRFKQRANWSTGETVYVGYLTDPDDDASFVSITSFVTTSLTASELTLDLGTAAGTNEVLAFQAGTSGYSFLIDDIYWEPIPTCLTPTALSVSDISTTGATLNWDENGSAMQWNLKASTTLFNPETEPGMFPPTSSGTNPFIIPAGLTPSTTYYWAVQADCSGGDVSAWSNVGMFTTECEEFAVPHFEGFEGVNMPGCWTILNIDGDANEWIIGDGNLAPYEGTKTASISYNASGNNDWLISPRFEITNINTALSFFAKSRSSSFLEDFNVLISTTGTNPADFTIVLENVNNHPITWQEHLYLLSDYGITPGQSVNIAIQSVSIDEFNLYIDAFNMFIVPQIDEIDIDSDVEDIAVCQGTAEATAIAGLAQQITITDTEATEYVVNLTWTIASYDANTPADYTATGTFALPAGVIQSDPATPLVVTAIITVSAPAPAEFSFNTTYCVGTIADALPATSDNGYTGTWNVAVISTAVAGNTNYTFTPDGGQCALSVVIPVTVNDPITPSFSFETTYCVAATADALPTTSDDGYTGTWDVAAISTAAAGNTNYTFTPDGGQCALNAVIPVTVNDPVAPTFSFDTEYCVGDVADILPTTSDNGFTGTWVDATINTAVSGSTDYTFTPDAGECATPATISVTVNDLPVVTCPADFEVTTTDIVVLSGALPVDGEYTGTNVTLGEFNPDGLANGPYTILYTYTNIATGCSSFCEFIITVNIAWPEIDVIDVNNDVEDIAVCAGTIEADAIALLANEITISDADANEHLVPVTWTIASYDENTAADYNATGTFALPFNVSQTDPATTLEVYAVVTVNANTVPAFAFETTYCAGETADLLPLTSDNGVTGTWAPATIDTNIEGATDYVFTPDGAICATPVTISVTVNPILTPAFSFETTYCIGATADALPLTSDNGVTGTWDITTINTASAGSTDYTFTPDAGQCANDAIVAVSVNDVTTPTFSFATEYCFGETADLLPLTSENGITGTWLPVAINTSTSGITDYTFTEDAGQCASGVIVPVTVNALPVVICPANMLVAVDAPVAFTGQNPVGGVFTGTGVDGNDFDPNGLADGDYTVTYTYTDVTTGCSNFCEFTVTVDLINGIITPDAATISIYPNPNNGQFNLNISNVNGEVNYQIYDTKGSIIVDENIISNGNTVKEISLNLVPGVYYVKLITNAQTVVEKLVIE